MDERRKIERETIEKMRMHFVFNSLNGIHHMIGKDQALAQEMVYDLSVVMRAYVDIITCDAKIPVEDELQAVESYIRLLDAGRDYLKLEVRGDVSGEINPGGILNLVVERIKEEVVSQTFLYSVIVTVSGDSAIVEIVMGSR